MAEQMTFTDLGLSAKVLDAINKKGFEEPTENPGHGNPRDAP